jgi:hypothetical protein
MMPVTPPFALGAYLSDKFPLLTLGGGLFYRWPIGIRFELGLELCRERAPRLYEAVFSREDSCVIVAQDWPHDLPPAARQRCHRVFSLPGAFDSNHPLPLHSVEVNEEDENQNFSLQWGQLPARSFRYSAVMEGVANSDHARTPSVPSRVYFLNPATGVIMHMYDDRGLDIIAARRETLVPLYRSFNEWALENDHGRIAKLFAVKSNSDRLN